MTAAFGGDLFQKVKYKVSQKSNQDTVGENNIIYRRNQHLRDLVSGEFGRAGAATKGQE